MEARLPSTWEGEHPNIHSHQVDLVHPEEGAVRRPSVFYGQETKLQYRDAFEQHRKVKTEVGHQVVKMGVDAFSRDVLGFF